jgi:hypothetical protein
MLQDEFDGPTRSRAPSRRDFARNSIGVVFRKNGVA